MLQQLESLMTFHASMSIIFSVIGICCLAFSMYSSYKEKFTKNKRIIMYVLSFILLAVSFYHYSNYRKANFVHNIETQTIAFEKRLDDIDNKNKEVYNRNSGIVINNKYYTRSELYDRIDVECGSYDKTAPLSNDIKVRTLQKTRMSVIDNCHSEFKTEIDLLLDNYGER